MTYDAAMLYNTEEFVYCQDKKFNISQYVQSGAQGYSKCFIYLHTGHKPVRIIYNFCHIFVSNYYERLFFPVFYALFDVPFWIDKTRWETASGKLQKACI